MTPDSDLDDSPEGLSAQDQEWSQGTGAFMTAFNACDVLMDAYLTAAREPEDKRPSDLAPRIKATRAAVRKLLPDHTQTVDSILDRLDALRKFRNVLAHNRATRKSERVAGQETWRQAVRLHDRGTGKFYSLRDLRDELEEVNKLHELMAHFGHALLRDAAKARGGDGSGLGYNGPPPPPPPRRSGDH